MAGTYDNTLRHLLSSQPGSLARWLLGVDPPTADRAHPLDGELAATPIRPDGVFELDDRLIHVEFQARAARADIEPRLVDYWSRLYRRFRRPPEQHVVVLVDRGRLSGEFRLGGLSLRYHAHHLWELDPEPLLADPWLLPLAALARAPDGDRIALLAEIDRRLLRVPDLDERFQLARHTVTLANAVIDRPTLESVLRRFTTMPIDLSFLPIYQEARAEGHARGHEEGLEEGRAKGLEEGRAKGRAEGRAGLLVEQLRRRLGALEPAHEDRIRSLRAETLDQLAIAVFDLTTHAELDRWLDAHEGTAGVPSDDAGPEAGGGNGRS